MKPDPIHVGMRYRPEIDGLRALAVLPVVLFHAGFEAFSGGFVGVDVFFVISGYLITSIVVNDLERDRFSVRQFYERRARRILPALFLVIAASWLLAWYCTLPVETQSFARSELAALVFVPNVYFWRTTSYFGTAAEKLPLLHTWSLGVEEQFYVVFPLVLAALWRWRRTRVIPLLALLACLSFALSEFGWRMGKVSSTFYLAPTRAWELLLGALLSLANGRGAPFERVKPLLSNLASATGLALLLGSVVLFRKDTPTPSVYAAMPTLGTCLVIAFAGPRTLAYRLLSVRPLVGVGLISYSTYLWHQPLFAFARLRMGHEPSLGQYAALIAISLILSYLAWRYVERPFRSAKTIPTRSLVRSMVASWTVLVAVALAAEATTGFSSRLRPEDLPLAAFADGEAQGRYVEARFDSHGGAFSSSGKTKVLVVGDSHAQDLVNAIFESGVDLTGFEIRTAYVPFRCQVYFGSRDVTAEIAPSDRHACSASRDLSPALAVAELADAVIVCSDWQPWAARLVDETTRALGSARRPVVVVGPKHIGHVDIRSLLDMTADQRLLLREPVPRSTFESEAILRQIVPHDRYVSMQEAVCGVGHDCGLFTPRGDLISHDGSHLTRAGAGFVGPRLLAMSPLRALFDVRAPAPSQ